MSRTQIIDPHELRIFIEIHQDFLRPKFPEPRKTSKRGRPRIGLRWVVIAICVYARVSNIIWEDLPTRLKNCGFLIDEGYLRSIPKRSTFHDYWNEANTSSWRSWIRMSGHALTSDRDQDIAIDSSGFKMIIGKVWRLIKWKSNAIVKTSDIFCKVHLAVALPSRAIVAIETSRSRVHDSVAFGPIWKHMYARVKRRIKRTHLDKGYWSENIINLMHQEGKQAVIPIKSNSVDHGTSSPMDLLIRQQNKMPGLYRRNNKTYLRAEVEHVFGEVTLYHVIPRDYKMDNKLKTLLSMFLWYNHERLVKEVRS
ncbi:MAG: transposase [Candidatus Heimdallarchaeota archaeon]|nr:transposase [Candidatus Heimdallarchaeota archaeon]